MLPGELSESEFLERDSSYDIKVDVDGIEYKITRGYYVNNLS